MDSSGLASGFGLPALGLGLVGECLGFRRLTN